jgi:hypothetical protein
MIILFFKEGIDIYTMSEISISNIRTRSGRVKDGNAYNGSSIPQANEKPAVPRPFDFKTATKEERISDLYRRFSKEREKLAILQDKRIGDIKESFDKEREKLAVLQKKYITNTLKFGDFRGPNIKN